MNTLFFLMKFEIVAYVKILNEYNYLKMIANNLVFWLWLIIASHKINTFTYYNQNKDNKKINKSTIYESVSL